MGVKQYRALEGYDSHCTIAAIETDCYSRQRFEQLQMEGAILAGSMQGNGKHSIGTLSIWGQDVDYQDLEYNRHLYKPCGYIQCEDDTYLVVVKRNWYMLLWLLLVILLISGGLFYYLNRDSGPDLEPGLQKFQAVSGLPDDYGKTSFIIPAYNQIHMKAGESTAHTALWNPEKNQVYFKFSIELRESGAVIYESRLVPPAMAIQNVQFERSFAKGEYPITIRVRTYDAKDYKQELNSGEVQTELLALHTAN